MRTGPFSSPQIIDRLNSLFVPVYAVNEDYREGGAAPEAEKAELERIYRETLAAGMSAGTVHVYVLAPGGKIFGSLHVADAAKIDRSSALLDRMTAQLGTNPGPPLVAPCAQAVAPAHAQGSLVLHLASRPLTGQGSWEGLAEDWIDYTPDEHARLVPAEVPLTVGESWSPDSALVTRLLRHTYPITENNDAGKNQLLEQSLTARVVSVERGIVRARLDGRLRMRHDFYFKPDGNIVDATLLGDLEIDGDTRVIRRFRLVTPRATYGGGRFGVVIRSEPAAKGTSP
jgi:hypothetical protein